MRLTGTGGDQIADSASINMSGGVLDVNGNAETVTSLTGSTGGTDTLANSATNTLATLTGIGSFSAQEFRFDVAAGSTLLLPSIYTFAGSGPLHAYAGAGGMDTGTTILSGSSISINVPILIDTNTTLQLGDGGADGGLSGRHRPLRSRDNGTFVFNSSSNLGLSQGIGVVRAPVIKSVHQPADPERGQYLRRRHHHQSRHPPNRRGREYRHPRRGPGDEQCPARFQPQQFVRRSQRHHKRHRLGHSIRGRRWRMLTLARLAT